MKILDLTNEEIIEKGGVFLKELEEFNSHYDGYIRNKVFELNGEEVISSLTWEFLGR